MHTTEEIYFKEDFSEDIEINLFEPECIIITDNANEDAYLFLNMDEENASVDQESNIQSENDLSFKNHFNVGYNIDLKDCQFYDTRDNILLEDNEPNILNNGIINNSSINNTNSIVDLENIHMHSIFMPDKRHKPKEIFTKCHFCGKYVIVCMSSETGTYSKCKYCFNNPFKSDNDVPSIFETSVNSIPNNFQLEISKKPNLKPFVQIGNSSNSKPEGSFRCDHCGKWFTRNWYLKQHKKLHSNDKPFSCNYCDKRFLNSSNLKQHMKTHSFEYRCSYCNKSFISASALNEHSLKHATDQQNTKIDDVKSCIVNHSKLLQCYFCKKHCINNNSFKEHLLMHTSDLINARNSSSVNH